jgi:hypothetical protein
MAVISIVEMFGISGRRDELATLLERFGSWAGTEPGCSGLSPYSRRLCFRRRERLAVV